MSDIEHEFNENYRYAFEFYQGYEAKARIYTEAAAGKIWSDSERAKLAQEGREPLELNIMRRPLSFFSGFMRDNLNSILYSPAEPDDDKTADQLTRLSYDIWEKGDGYSSFLDGYDEAFKSATSLIGIRLDKTTDVVNGDIKFFYRTYNQF